MQRTNAKSDMWTSGWILGKYDQLQHLPTSVSDAKKWWDGFAMGTVEACLYERVKDRLYLLLSDYPETYQLIQKVIN